MKMRRWSSELVSAQPLRMPGISCVNSTRPVRRSATWKTAGAPEATVENFGTPRTEVTSEVLVLAKPVIVAAGETAYRLVLGGRDGPERDVVPERRSPRAPREVPIRSWPYAAPSGTAVR